MQETAPRKRHNMENSGVVGHLDLPGAGLFCHGTRQYSIPANKKNSVMKCLKFQCK